MSIYICFTYVYMYREENVKKATHQNVNNDYCRGMRLEKRGRKGKISLPVGLIHYIFIGF